MSTVPAFFLGANSPAGFYSLYSELISPTRARRIYLIKGGPGCGKSTLMRLVEQQVLQTGLSTQRIFCSGDPDSLDALLLPELNVALADATSPHALEPKFPGVVEEYVNLGSCYDHEGLQSVREEIMSCMTGYPACYRRAYRCLDAAFELAEDVRDFAATPDGSAVYYINEDEELIWQKGTKEGKRIADDVDYVFTTHDGYCFFESDDELFSVKDGGKKVRIADDLYDIYVTGSVFYLWTDYEDGEFNFYACTKGNKLKELYTY